MTTRRNSVTAHLLLLAVVALWGGTFVLVKDSLTDASPLLFNQIRMTFAFIVLSGIHWQIWRNLTRTSLIAGALAGVFLAAGYDFQTTGLARTTPSKSAFLTGLVVVFVPLLSAIPKLRPPETNGPRTPAILGAALAFLGILRLTLPAGTPLNELRAAINLGDLLSLACALGFALHLLTLGRMARQVPTSQLVTLQIGFCALCMSLATPSFEKSYLHLTPRLVISLTICAVFATAAAFSVQTWAQQHLKPTHTALLLSLEPAFAWFMSLFLRREAFSLRSAQGAGLIFAGILVTELLTSPVALEPEANQP
jgi:drug/metabolite transporter (DMT)-like permease